MQHVNFSTFRHLGIAVLLALTTANCGGSSGSTDATATDNTSDPSTTGPGTMTGDETAGPSTTDDTDATSPSGSETTTDPSTTAAETETETDTDTGTDDPVMGFFVSSSGSLTGNLGGLAGADQRCQELATAVGAGNRTWRAYLSADKGDNDEPVHARDRIGEGPWYNAALVLLAADLDELHTLDGDQALFLDESGEMVNGQWEGSPDPNEHDILTGSNRDGTLAEGKTCLGWTSEDSTQFAQVGHSDGLGPMMSDDELYRPWNSVHESGGCHDTAPKGGAGRVYCFAAD